ncbi:uncharacterized protein LOC117519684 [Thalassophryne amazonica]|uniref:uncharacterized protein LOC117519684 n=1 Tax=Thalassophryne amazonica TaxID=390379 RepID=UPI001471DA99|nr:uncharacterized protein LOC117519684 [Thalassophryne amazonica]
MLPIQKPWFNNSFQKLLRAWDTALRSGDREEYRRARVNLHRGIALVKQEYKRNIEDNFSATWQGESERQVQETRFYKFISWSRSHTVKALTSIMKLLLLFFCVNLSSGLFKGGSGQGQGVAITVTDIDNMLNAIQSTPYLEIRGDSLTGECVRGQQDKRQPQEAGDFQLDLWTDVTCTFAVVTTGPEKYAQLYSPNRSVPGVSLQTLYLPLFRHNSASYTFVPHTMTPTFFVTATLTGCDIFVASSGHNLNCPLVVIHTNACGTMTTDVNQLEALAVLSTNLCQQRPFQIKYRVASSEHRTIIEHGNYHYSTEYYNPTTPSSFFGYTKGGSSATTMQPWVFCRKNGLSTGMACHPVVD